jgi:hypothetical protein
VPSLIRPFVVSPIVLSFADSVQKLLFFKPVLNGEARKEKAGISIIEQGVLIEVSSV